MRDPAKGAMSWLLVISIVVVSVVVLVFWPATQSVPPQYADAIEAQRSRVEEPEMEEPAQPPVSPAALDASEQDEHPEAESVEIPGQELQPAAPDPEELIEQMPAEQDPAASAPQASRLELPFAEVKIVEGEREFIVHKTVPSETVDQIAFRYSVKPQMLRIWNGLKQSTKRVKNGAELKVRPRQIPPARREFEYIVQPGDSWWKIGINFGVDSVDLRNTNWSTAQRLRVGDRLKMWVDPVVFQWIAVEERDETQDGYIRPGAVGIGPPQDGRLVNGVKAPENPYYRLRMEPTSYGTTHAVAQLQEGVIRFKARSDYPRPLILGSMSAKHGGPLAGHRSHQTGRDIDIRLPLRATVPEWMEVTPKRVDWVAVWELISAMVETGEVTVVFLDYELQEHLHAAAVSVQATDEERRAFIQWPRGSKAHLGMVRHSPGHVGHLHIRFACGEYETECATSAEGTVVK